tara:strand:- start:11220 stop:11981 length:762 start_codon:yes stop_codon:yes gene_type:complete
MRNQMTEEIYYGQEGQDSIIKQFFEAKGIKKGTFLDVGSLDGIRFSNTYLLEKTGWTGICVEMHPSYFDMLVENRPNSICYSCAAADKDKVKSEVSLNWRASLSSSDLTLEQYYGENSGWKPWYGDRDKKEINGFLNGRHNVEFRTLDSIIEENKKQFPKINFVSIDIDGSETQALPHLDLKKCNPELLSLEHNIVGGDYITKYAANHGYHPALLVGEDILFVTNKEDAELLHNFSIHGEQYHNDHPCDEKEA